MGDCQRSGWKTKDAFNRQSPIHESRFRGNLESVVYQNIFEGDWSTVNRNWKKSVGKLVYLNRNIFRWFNQGNHHQPSVWF